MRKIKFRAWEKNLKEIIPVYDISFENKIINSKSAWRFFHEVELMQYTGLEDRNGKEIYKGDIIKFFDGLKYIVDINDFTQEFVIDSDRGQERLSQVYQEVEVIGNIYINLINSHVGLEVIGNCYENPELLEENV